MSTGDLPASVHAVAARTISSAASIASGRGKYGLANQLWAFEAELREQARDDRERMRAEMREAKQ